MTAEVRVFDDPAEAASDLLGRHVATGGHIALTGGSTPRPAYERAAAMDVDWSAATLWFGDERCVPPDDERSNYAMAKAALLDRIPDPGPAVHRIAGELGPDRGADDYEAQLREALGEGSPSLDLVLLGLGSDGHCASLFPGKPEVGETQRLVVGVPEAGLEPFVPRVSFTLRLIDAAREVVFLVTGAGKAEAVARAFGGAPDPATPASLVAPTSGSLTVLLDPAAAALLEVAST
jgi:6-phosphogluconolactonase